MAETASKSWTYLDLVAQGLDPDRYEIVNGALVELTEEPTLRGSRVFTRLAMKLGAHVEDRRLGAVYTTGRFLLREEPRVERRPDLAFLTADRIPDPEPDMFPGAPDIAVEVLSPSDPTGAAREKAEQYLQLGAKEAWIVAPSLDTITVLRAGHRPKAFSAGDTLTSSLLPGFRLDLADLFAPVVGP